MNDSVIVFGCVLVILRCSLKYIVAQCKYHVEMAAVQYYSKCQSTVELYVLFGHVP